MTLTPGYYRTRDGRKAHAVYCEAPGNFPVMGYIVDGPRAVEQHAWKLNGNFSVRLDDGHDLDLIEPWTEPKSKKRIELRRALMRTIVPPMSRSESVTHEYYRTEWVSLNYEDDISFLRWLDEEPMIIEVEGE